VWETTVRASTTLWSVVETATLALVASSFWNREVSTGRYRNDRTHGEDLKDIVEVQLPGGDRLFVVLHVEVSRDYIPFTPLDELLVNVCHGPTIEYFSGRSEADVVGSTHNFNRFIAPYTDGLSSSGFFPFVPLSSARQTLAQSDPSSI
jgi:hypothetical protein